VIASRAVSPFPEAPAHLAVGHLGNDRADGADVGKRGDVALTHVELGGDGEMAELGEAPADVADVLVDAEDLLHHEHHREGTAGRRLGPVGGDHPVGDRDLHLAGDEAVGGGGDRLGAHRLDGEGEPGGERGHGAAAAQRGVVGDGVGGKGHRAAPARRSGRTRQSAQPTARQ
jgi:hypothetical protein